MALCSLPFAVVSVGAFLLSVPLNPRMAVSSTLGFARAVFHPADKPYSAAFHPNSRSKRGVGAYPTALHCASPYSTWRQPVRGGSVANTRKGNFVLPAALHEYEDSAEYVEELGEGDGEGLTTESPVIKIKIVYQVHAKISSTTFQVEIQH